LKNDKVILAGKVLNYENHPEYFKIHFDFEDLLFIDEKYEARIDNNGNFKIEVPCSYPQDFMVWNTRWITLFCSPGDSLYIEINGDAEDFKTERNISDYIQVTGGNAITNTHVPLFVNEIWKRQNWDEHKKLILESTPEKYKEYLFQKEKEYLAVLDTFNKTHPTSKLFKKWSIDYITYKTLNELIQYRFQYMRYHNIRDNSYHLPDSYYSFLNNYDISKNKIISSSHSEFLHYYSMYVEYELMPADTIYKMRELYNNNYHIEANKVRINNILRNTNGFTQDVLIAKFFANLIYRKELDDFKALYNPDLIQKLFRMRIMEKYKKLKSIQDNPEFISETKFGKVEAEIIKPFIDTVLSKYQGKVVYIDFWAPWCGPCMLEMPFSKKIYNKYFNKDIIFLFLANRCSEKSWKGTIAEKQIPGEHYLLTYKQYSVLSNKFNIKGIPHYMLIDKKGRIVDPNAPRPSNTKKIIERFDKLLEH